MGDKVITITGANGFIGESLTKYFLSKGYRVRALIRNQNFDFGSSMVEVFPYNIGADNDLSAIKGSEVVIHCAYSFLKSNSSSDEDLNLMAARQLKSAVKEFNVSRVVFISSLSAHEKAISSYGKSKLNTEAVFNESCDLIIRPGLVVGNGGLFKRLIEAFKKNRIIPIVGGGRQPLYITYIDDLVSVIYQSVSNNVKGAYNIASAEAINMRAFYAMLDEHLGGNRFFINVPYWLIELLVNAAKKLGIVLPVSLENMQGLKSMREVDVSSSEDKLKFKCREAKKSIEAFFE